VQVDLVNTADESKHLSTTISNIGEESRLLRDTIVNGLRNESFCSNTSSPEFSYNLNEEKENIVTVLEDIDNFNVDYFSSLDNHIFEWISHVGEHLQVQILQYHVLDWIALGYSIALATMASFMMIGTLRSCYARLEAKLLNCFLTWFILPVFIICIMLSWILCSTVGAGIVMNSGE